MNAHSPFTCLCDMFGGHVYVRECGHTCATVHVWGSENNVGVSLHILPCLRLVPQFAGSLTADRKLPEMLLTFFTSSHRSSWSMEATVHFYMGPED